MGNIKNHFYIYISTLMTVGCLGARAYCAPQTITVNGKQLGLVWSDEFDYVGKPDLSKWTYDTGTEGDGWGNEQLQYYTPRQRNSHVENGHLIIEAHKEDYQSSNYTSARLTSIGDGWKYGHFEFKAKLPRGAGTWPCIWMLATQVTYGSAIWPDNGEIDVVEHVGRDPQDILGSFYSTNFIWYLNNGKTAMVSLPDVETDFHLYALDWDEDQISISVDGVTYNRFPNPHTDWQDWPFDQNFSIIINLAIGGGFAGPVDDSIFPQRFMIKYVRIYQQVMSEPVVAGIAQ